jgi:hypothetical protein
VNMHNVAKTSAAVLALIAALGPAPQAGAAPKTGVLPVGPSVGDQDLSPFYRWTGKLPARPGVMLREEPFPAQPDIPDAGAALRILYSSMDVRWNSGILPVSGTLHLPKGKPPQGGWPLVAWAHGTLGVADSCAPSWAGHRPRDAAYIDEWLKRGFAVVSTDYQGLGGPGPHPNSIWQALGRSVLDGVRSSLAKHKGEIANVVIITGQSQGSGAALGATRLQPTYAPDLNLRASIATGVSPIFPDAQNRYVRPTVTGNPPDYTVEAMVGGGLRDGSPAPEEMLTDKGRVLLAAIRTRCTTAEFRRIEAAEGVTAENAFKDPDQISGLQMHGMDMTPVKMPAPVFLGTGLADTTVAPQRQYVAAAALCSAGSHVVWKTYSGITHNGGVHAALKDELSFVDAALRGTPEPSNCATIKEPGAPGIAEPGHPFND